MTHCFTAKVVFTVIVRANNLKTVKARQISVRLSAALAPGLMPGAIETLIQTTRMEGNENEKQQNVLRRQS